MIITNPKSEINKILISSQIDADRLDYLPRDSHFTGTKYGNIDYDNIFKKAIVFNDQLCFSKHS